MMTDGDEVELAVVRHAELARRNGDNAAVLRHSKVSIENLLRFAESAKSSANAVSAETFVRLATEEALPVLDVRSPAEFAQGHISCPHCLNIPLFSNEERHKVGLQYNRRGKGPAMLMGMRLVEPKLDEVLTRARTFCAQAEAQANGQAPNRWPGTTFSIPGRKRPLVGVHCWRGGMRSASIAWWLKQAGFQPVLLKGGYKAYREWALNIYTTPLPRPWSPLDRSLARTTASSGGPRICIVGGRTGSGKTRILHAMQHMGAQVLDLEGLARHRGSAFGWIAQDPQPSSEQFMNDCADTWRTFDTRRWIFVEDEGPAIGKCSTPPVLYNLMRNAPLVVKVVVPMEARLRLLVEDYSGAEALKKSPDWQEKMVESIERMIKRLGGERTKKAVDAVLTGDMRLVAETLITYYDKLYDRHIANEGGNGSGKGERLGSIVMVEAPSDASELDAHAVGRLVIEQSRLCNYSSRAADIS
jgi:tRNA 2-selenouridine synthase